MSAALDDRAEGLRLIRDSAGAIAPRGGDLRRIRALRFHKPGFDGAVWRQMAEMGWLGLIVPERLGGAGLGLAELCALAEELGAALCPEPLIEAVVTAPLVPHERLDEVLAGDRVVIPAWAERANGLPGDETASLNHGRVWGRKVFVPMAAGADAFLVSTRDGLALVDAEADGLCLTTELTQDGGHVGTLSLDGAAGEPVPGEIGAALDHAALAAAAYLVGVMDRAFAMTLDYMRTRQQFGRAIGSFQALQHRAADLKIQIELARASVDSAAAVVDGMPDDARRQSAVSRAKARASDAAMLVTRQCIQLHGGIGYTDEYDIGLFLRKAMVLSSLHGNAALHRARFAAVTPEGDEDE